LSRSKVSKVSGDDTIVAIATAVGESGIGIVRLSGAQALSIADRIFYCRSGHLPSSFSSYTIHYGWIRDDTFAGEAKESVPGGMVDEVLLTVMRAPRSYTREDVVEINCHGGIIALRRVLELTVSKGARLAAPGEFTQRAFLNGRIDLAQAEAVLDIIRAKTDSALRIGVAQLKGRLSREMQQIRKGLLRILAALETTIDFPEDGGQEVNGEDTRAGLEKILHELSVMVEAMHWGRVYREGVKVVICGKPNVGKSSLLNALLKQERSIVTAVSGTTRDCIEEVIDIRGIPVRIVDTAGIIEPRDLIEKEAVKRSRQQIADADIVLLLFDGSRKLDRLDALLMKKVGARKAIAVINKIDLPQKIEVSSLACRFKQVFSLSAKKLRHLERLEEAIEQAVASGKTIGGESVMAVNVRHAEALKEAKNLIAEGLVSVDNKVSVEFVAQAVKDALGKIDCITGKEFSEELLEEIFSEFCIGK
jgi:tRNA modification GTPase